MLCLHPISVQPEHQFKRLPFIDFLLLLRGENKNIFWNAYKLKLPYRLTVKTSGNPFYAKIKYLRLESIFERENL